jgi:Ca-activated chloride channel family protein
VGTGGSVRAETELTVEAEVAAPRGARVAGVRFYWLDEPVGTLYTPPYRQRVVLPSAGARGFVRVVVTLADGAAVEEVLFVNSAGSSDRVQVTLVELLVVVTDEAGRPVPDLERSAFTVEEGGEVQELAVFNSSADMPLTVGLAIDSSASMFVKLPTVQVAAMDFLRGVVSERDRGFVVGFGREPALLSPTTGDVKRLVSAVEALRPDGFTSIWKGIVYSLVQLQGTPGKKALIVYSDGADEDPDFSYRTARRFARVVGVPLYVILSNNEIVRTQGLGLNIRSFLGRLEDLVDDVGGKVYMTRVGADLQEVYAEIADELRSQYVVGYYGEQDEGGGWRDIEVEVAVPGLEVRAARGRYR